MVCWSFFVLSMSLFIYLFIFLFLDSTEKDWWSLLSFSSLLLQACAYFSKRKQCGPSVNVSRCC